MVIVVLQRFNINYAGNVSKQASSIHSDEKPVLVNGCTSVKGCAFHHKHFSATKV